MEQQLITLGEKLKDRTPALRVFSEAFNSEQSQESSITIQELIDLYMKETASKKTPKHPKTNMDKLAAFRYLTKMFGGDFKITALTSDHFEKIANLLAKFPKNADKAKIYKNMTLAQLQETVDRDNRPIMTARNANKIIARIKSLMEYAV